jgi:hypothetical protein
MVIHRIRIAEMRVRFSHGPPIANFVVLGKDYLASLGTELPLAQFIVLWILCLCRRVLYFALQNAPPRKIFIL